MFEIFKSLQLQINQSYMLSYQRVYVACSISLVRKIKNTINMSLLTLFCIVGPQNVNEKSTCVCMSPNDVYVFHTGCLKTMSRYHRGCMRGDVAFTSGSAIEKKVIQTSR